VIMGQSVRVVTASGLVLLLVGCNGNTADLGGNKEDASGNYCPDRVACGSGQDASVGHDSAAPGYDSGGDSSAGSKANKCHGSGAAEDASSRGALDAMAQPTSCTISAQCVAPDVCNMLPGSIPGQCGPACESDCDCPAWLTCQDGLCSQCSIPGASFDAPEWVGCPAGQWCSVVSPPAGHGCTSSPECGLAGYCQGGNCWPIHVCTECYGDCQSDASIVECASNGQCAAGQVCVGNTCQTCTSDSQCGPTAKCTATHTGVQCTCSQAADCAPGATCASGVCASGGVTGCAVNGCQDGQACVNGACGACSTFEDCNTATFGGPMALPGLACNNGVCSACSSNSQCGGGQACVGGTCGTCATSAQCGPSGQCSDGYCICSTDAQCQAGQRCGAGVCVEM
jgi:hypothetical protein